MSQTGTTKTIDIFRYCFMKLLPSDFLLPQLASFVYVNDSNIPHLFPISLYLWSGPVLEILWKSECPNVFSVGDDKYFQLQHIRSLRAAFRKTDDWILVWNVYDLFVNQSWFYFYHPYLFRIHPVYNLHIRSYLALIR